MTPVTYGVPHELTSPRFALAFATGCGGQVEPSPTLRPGPVALFGSPARWALLQQAIAEGRRWYYGDHGWFGRGAYVRVTADAYQPLRPIHAGPERFARFGLTVQPWRRGGRHVLVCVQSDTHYRLHGLDPDTWLADVRRTLRWHTDRPVVIRRKGDLTPIAAALEEDASAVVTHSSATAVDALLAGVPVFVLAPWAAAARMGRQALQAIEAPHYPDDREAFLWDLAAQQWTFDEIARGEAWAAIQAHDEEIRDVA